MEMLPVLVKALNDLGHKCELITVDGARMKELVLGIGKGDHAASMKKTATPERTAFDPEAYIARFPELCEEKTYVLGFTFVPSTTLAVNKLSEFNEHLDPALHPIYFADFGHLGGPNKGVYGAAGRLDANRHWFPSADLMYFANESGTTWGELLDAVKATDVRLESDGSILLADGDKGMQKVVNSTKFFYLDFFICAYHRGKSVAMSPGGAAAKVIYDQMVHAPQPQFDVLEKRLNPKARKYLRETHDRNQYMSQVGTCMHGHYTSNAAESMQHAALPVRQLSPFAAILRLLADQKRRHESNAAECVDAHTAGMSVPPRVFATCAAAYEEGKKYAHRLVPVPPLPTHHLGLVARLHRYTAVTFHGEGYWEATVGSYKNPGMTYKCNIQHMHCECKVPEVTGFPCAHLFAAGFKGGKDPYTYLDCANSMHGWRKTYCEAVRPWETREGEAIAADASVWHPLVGNDATGFPNADHDAHGLPKFRDVPTNKLELKLRKYPAAPSMAQLGEMFKRGEGVVSNLALPPVVRQARGRPPSTKRKLGVLERGGTPRKRAVATCSNCQQKGHRCDKCPFMQRAALPRPSPPAALALASPPPVGAAGASGGFAGAL